MQKGLKKLRSSICSLIIVTSVSVLWLSCEKIPGHSLVTTPVIKAGTVTFSVGDTAHSLSTTTSDTVNFISVSNPAVLTTINATNGQRPLSLMLSFKANITGTFNISNFKIVYVQNTGTVVTASSNIGNVTVTSINTAGGLITGSFKTPIRTGNHATDTATVTGTFNIQQ